MHADWGGDAEAIAAARALGVSCDDTAAGAIVTLCSDAFWENERPRSAFFDVAAPGYDAEVVRDFEAGDVQARQAAAMTCAIAMLQEAGLDWMLHIDIDELWYSPHPGVQHE